MPEGPRYPRGAPWLELALLAAFVAGLVSLAALLAWCVS